MLLGSCSSEGGGSTTTPPPDYASPGFVVVAPDHEGDTLFDLLDETESDLDNRSSMSVKPTFGSSSIACSRARCSRRESP